jgi:hypothetical protein
MIRQLDRWHLTISVLASSEAGQRREEALYVDHD